MITAVCIYRTEYRIYIYFVQVQQLVGVEDDSHSPFFLLFSSFFFFPRGLMSNFQLLRFTLLLYPFIHNPHLLAAVIHKRPYDGYRRSRYSYSIPKLLLLYVVQVPPSCRRY